MDNTSINKTSGGFAQSDAEHAQPNCERRRATGEKAVTEVGPDEGQRPSYLLPTVYRISDIQRNSLRPQLHLPWQLHQIAANGAAPAFPLVHATLRTPAKNQSKTSAYYSAQTTPTSMPTPASPSTASSITDPSTSSAFVAASWT